MVREPFRFSSRPSSCMCMHFFHIYMEKHFVIGAGPPCIHAPATLRWYKPYYYGIHIYIHVYDIICGLCALRRMRPIETFHEFDAHTSRMYNLSIYAIRISHTSIYYCYHYYYIIYDRAWEVRTRRRCTAHTHTHTRLHFAYPCIIYS